MILNEKYSVVFTCKNEEWEVKKFPRDKRFTDLESQILHVLGRVALDVDKKLCEKYLSRSKYITYRDISKFHLECVRTRKARLEIELTILEDKKLSHKIFWKAMKIFQKSK